jgi:hypothetical protein
MKANRMAQSRSEYLQGFVSAYGTRESEVSHNRADFRFLLPSPDLGDVAYHGPSNEPLIRALRAVSSSVTELSDLNSASKLGFGFDVVVLRAPVQRQFDLALRLIKPNGFLYLELYGTGAWLGRRPDATFRHCLLASFLSPSQLVDSGVDYAEAYWCVPDADGCRQFIPLFEQTALEYTLARPRSALLSRVLAAFAQAAVRLRLFPRLVPSYVVLAHKRAKGRP